VAASVLKGPPSAAQDKFSAQSRAYDYLTAEELTVLEKAAKKARWGSRDWLAIRMAWRHGLRASELVGLEWTNVKWADGKLFIRRAKNGVSGEHWLDQDVLRALRRLKAGQATGTRFIFISERGGTWAAPSFSRMVERLGDRVLPERGVHAHMLRHSAGHLLAARNVATRTIQDYLGHKSISSTQIYTQQSGQHLKGIWG
jgi:integrase